MSEFEFISVFVSIVLAFAMAELLMGWGRLIRARSHVRKPLFYIGWTVWLLLLMSFHYVGIWEYQVVDFQTVGQLVLMLLPPIALVLLTFVLAPELIPGQEIDLEQHYFSVSNWLFGLSILFFLAGFSADTMLPDFAENWWAHSRLSWVIIITLALLIVNKNRAVHYGILVFNLVWLLLGSISQDVVIL